jgi:hypothetical protein
MVEALMPLLSDLEPRQLNRRRCNVGFAGENGRWPGHCCDRIRVFGKNSGASS